MEKEQYRFLFLEGKSRSFWKGNQRASAWMLYAVTVKNWFNEFQRGRKSIFDGPRPGAQKTAATEDNMKKIYDLILADHRLKVSEIAETLDISKGWWVISCMKYLT